jgi:hypothetical protein
MKTLYIPSYMGDSISVGGVPITADKDRCVHNIPDEAAAELIQHGLADVDDKEALKAVYAQEEAVEAAKAEAKAKAKAEDKLARPRLKIAGR